MTNQIQPQEQEHDKDILTRKEAAKTLRVSLPTLDKFSGDGTIKAYRLGGKVLYKRSEIIASLPAMKTKLVAA